MLAVATRLLASCALLLCVAESALAQQLSPLEEPGGARLEVREDGTLVRARAGSRTELRSTLAEGLGEVRSLASHPSGASYVASSRGLWITSTDVDTVDPLDLRDGVPEDAPRKIRIDGWRLFVEGERLRYVIDTRWFFGRVLGPVSEPEPDEGRTDAPRLLRCEAQRVEGELAILEYGGELGLALEAHADGGATYRWRRGGHHLWKPLDSDAPRVRGLSPGDHEIEVVALDRFLRWSEPATLRVRVPMPAYFEKRFLIAAAGGFAALIALLFFVRAGRLSEPGRWLRAGISTTVSIVLAISFVAVLVPHAKAWPFIGFSMYTERYDANAILYQPGLLGQRPDGRWIPIRSTDAGRPTDGYWQALIPLVFGGEEENESFLRDFNERNPERRLIGLAVQETRIRLTDHGPERVAPIRMHQYRSAR